ncbi:MAG: iron-containing alcohol dehydrogenase [Pontiella sp.]|nr:iron-containing alcohol dehydrogenase [Pontiella sp.]
MIFEFATAQRILFGCGTLRELPGLIPGTGRRVALITGSSAERVAPVFKALKECGAEPAAFSVSGEPTTDRINTLARQAREQQCDMVVAFGGGSVIDAGKAIAALLTNTRDLMDYLEVIGKGEPLSEDPAPCIAIPTTAGTGAEVTRNSVLLSPEHNVKVSMRHPKMLPTAAIVDPDLTLSMPPEVTASTGLDAFIQLLEAFVSAKANPLTDGICREGIRRVSRSLHRAYKDGTDLEARTGMAFGSLCGGLALSNAGLGAVHGFAGPLGGMFKAPHGMVCASLLPAVMKANIQALEERAAENPALEKYQEVAVMLTGSGNARLSDGLDWVNALCEDMPVSGLEAFGVTAGDIPDIVEKARQASSMKGNPIQLTNDELAGILADSLESPIHGNSGIDL